MSDIEREAFERAMNGEAEFRWLSGAKQYVSAITQKMWETWQAARQAPASGEVEPVAWVSSALYGSNLTFQKPAPPEGWEDYADDWYCYPLYTHPPAKVPEGLIDAVQNLDPFEKDFGANFNDEFGVYHCNYCNARYEQDLCEKPELDHAKDCPVVKLRELLTTPTPATTPKTESCEWHSDENGCWVSACGKEWWFDEGGPEDNGMHFCIKCGKPCVELGNSEDGGEIYDSAL